MASCLGRGVTSIGARDIFLSRFAWLELSNFPCEVCRNTCHFCKSVESAQIGTQVTAVAMRRCKDPHRAQSAGGFLRYREAIFTSMVLLQSVLPLRWPSCLTPPSVSATTRGSRRWGRQLRKIPVLSIRSVYMLYAGNARGQS